MDILHSKALVQMKKEFSAKVTTTLALDTFIYLRWMSQSPLGSRERYYRAEALLEIIPAKLAPSEKLLRLIDLYISSIMSPEKELPSRDNVIDFPDPIKSAP